MSRRENTFRIDYSNVPRKPSYEDVHHFIANDLDLKKEEVLRIQCSRSSGCAFVKVCNLDLAQKVVTEHDNVHEFEVDGKAYKLRLRLEDGAVEVKLFDLSEDVSRQKIEEFLSAYGDVLKAYEQVWENNFEFAGVSTGLWVVRMMVKKNIPSYVTIDGEITYVQYFGQHQTCRHCGEFVHNGASCVQNKKLLLQKLSADKSSKKSYAKVASQKPTPGAIVRPRPTTTTPVAVASAANSSPSDSSSTASTPTASTLAPRQVAVVLSPLPSGKFKKPLSTSQLAEAEESFNRSNRSDEDETDDSSSSKSRGRPPGKKARTLNGDGARDKKHH